jgi:hypothetical protein
MDRSGLAGMGLGAGLGLVDFRKEPGSRCGAGSVREGGGPRARGGGVFIRAAAARPAPRWGIAHGQAKSPNPLRTLAAPHPPVRGGRASEAARFMASLRRAAAREQRGVFDRGELQVSRPRGGRTQCPRRAPAPGRV